MTLNRKLIFTSSCFVLTLLLLGVVAMVGLTQLRGNLDRALGEFAQVKTVAEVEKSVAAAHRYIDPTLERIPEATAALRQAVDALERYLTQEAQGGWDSSDDRQAMMLARDRIDAMADALEASTISESPTLNLALVAAVDDAMGSLAALSQHSQRTVEQIEIQAQRSTLAVIALMSLIGTIIIVTGIAVAWWQYQWVMRPLNRLRTGVRGIAEARFTQRLEETGDREFADLARDFNQMATQLDELYRDLEQKVEVKSRELVRSERLASVGFLAAGVAHEINNPLGIISGYAELSMKRLDRGPVDEEGRDDLRQSLSMMRDEAFRCKQIIEKLLSLARQGDSAREEMDLKRICNEVASMVRGLGRYRDRRLELVIDDGLPMMGNASEMKQVVLNLTVNALEATQPIEGRVVLRGRRDNGQIELVVDDNGCGMSQATLSRVFEPFYTERRSNGYSGTGLGLSVTHAIVQGHGGSIRAQSEGPGRGSRFTVRFPAFGKQGDGS
jgi:signal transduction histidine kinase